MNYFWVAAAVVLSFVVCIQYYFRRKEQAELRYMHRKLERIVADNTPEKLLMMTANPAARQLLAAINELLELNRRNAAGYARMEIAMRKMLSNISHDLKTPLTVVLGCIETTLQDPNMNDQERESLLRKAHQKSLEVTSLMNKFFDLARLESGDMAITLGRVNMNGICEKNILTFYDIITSKGCDVAIEMPEQTVYAYANEEALDRILNNLISNAITYGSCGRMIGLTLKTADSHVLVEVWDKGKGIREQYQERVFERLYTLEDSRNKSVQRSGLGLTITKRLVEKLGGRITLQSKPYERTVFSIYLKQIRS